MIREILDKITITLAIPFAAAFAVLTIFGQLCFDNLPYLVCGGNS